MTTDGVRPEELGELSPEELYALYMEKQVSFGMAGRALDRRRREGRVHVPAAEANVDNAGPDQRIIVGPELGFNVHNLHVFTSGRAGGSERYHTHGDALKHYIRGGGYELIEEERFEVKVGDFCHVPANVWHGTENPRPEPLVFLAAQQFPGTYRQVATPFVHLTAPQAASGGEGSVGGGAGQDRAVAAVPVHGADGIRAATIAREREGSVRRVCEPCTCSAARFGFPRQQASVGRAARVEGSSRRPLPHSLMFCAR